MNNFKAHFVILILSIIFPVELWADGNALLKQCVAAEKVIDGVGIKEAFDAGLCMGTVKGVRDTMAVMTENKSKIKVCFPENGISNGQSVRIVNHYLKNNPSELHENEIFLVMKAYLQAYPCK